ncbi:MAG: formate dehydrogenase accessory sulfurtransferase FdhD [Bacteroidota bacterium]
MKAYSPIEVWKVQEGQRTKANDRLAIEEPLEIKLLYGDGQEKSISITMRSPGNDKDLALGFLLTEGIIQKTSDVVQVQSIRTNLLQEEYNQVTVQLAAGINVDLERLERHFYTSSSCGVCGKTSIDMVKTTNPPTLLPMQPIFPANLIPQLPESLRQQQAVFEYTGGLHAAALFDSQGQILLLREDVGRHNAVDKLIGAAMGQEGLVLADCLILVSGRASFELIQKALMAGIPILAAVGAPSSLAVDLAKESGMTLLGFVRDGRYNIYCGGERIS